jgi:peroxiredoxin
LSQLGGLENDRAKFEEKGVQIIAIAVQSERDAATTEQLTRAQYPILADNDHAATEAYGVYNLLPDDNGEATPAVFIINQDGQVIWKSIAKDGSERVPSETILENLPK